LQYSPGFRGSNFVFNLAKNIHKRVYKTYNNIKKWHICQDTFGII
jgi:hypothetical protein